MFKNLIAEMARHGITRGELAKRLGISETSITNKMHGIRDWKLPEIIKITKMFPDVEFEKLFATEDDTSN